MRYKKEVGLTKKQFLEYFNSYAMFVYKGEWCFFIGGTCIKQEGGKTYYGACKAVVSPTAHDLVDITFEDFKEEFDNRRIQM